MKHRTASTIGSVIALLLLLAVAPPAAIGANLTLISPPLSAGGYLVSGTFRATVVNVGKKAVVATIQFCDAGGNCISDSDGQCVNVSLAPGHGCAIQHSAPSQWSARIQLSGQGPINARGALFLDPGDDGSFGGSVEAE